jgi:leucyl aminopeptidase
VYPNFYKVISSDKDISKENPNAVVFVIEPSKGSVDLRKSLTTLSKEEQEQVNNYAKDIAFKAEAGSVLSFDIDAKRSIFVIASDPKSETFFRLKHSRTLVERITARHRRRILLVNASVGWIDALLSAVVVSNFRPQKFGKVEEKNGKANEQLSLLISTTKEQAAEVNKIASASALEAIATNLVRDLTMLPANVLDCAGFVDRAKKLAKEQGLTCVVNDYKKLKQMKAGAFIAVAQGSSHEDSAIVQLSYRSTKSKKSVALVGKGITFDTGGVNVKTGTYMFGMHGDMMGAAVCLALISLAAKEKWPVNIDAYLAIADNAIGPDAFRPNEIVTAANKLTIETIHTDAEGRMVLADTLYFASKTKPDLIIDYATLTGSAIRAIGTNYSACFSNKEDLYPKLIAAGKTSGERVWPFPLDEDYSECLESKIADTKQCRLSGGPDHIEAAMFLKKFIEGEVPWIHIDLASSEQDGGLAHVGTKETGFGIRIGKQIIQNVLGI